MDSFYVPPGSMAEPTNYAPPPEDKDADKVVGEHFDWSSNETNKAPQINLFQAKESPQPAAAPVVVPPQNLPVKKNHVPMIIIGVLVGLVAASGVYVFATGALGPHKKGPAPIIPSTTPKPSAAPCPSTSPATSPHPSPTISVSPSPSSSARPSSSPCLTPTPTPSESPSPSPSPTPSTVPVTVTLPTTTPTTSNPQAVKVTSSSGLWLRSTPSSVNRSNIIGWMPKGAVVSVDQEGSFWWHGTYNGRSGYFASSYTQ